MINNQLLLKNIVSTAIAALLFLALSSLAPAAELELENLENYGVHSNNSHGWQIPSN